MSIGRSFFGDSDPVGGRGRIQELRPDTRTGILAVGTLACPECDAPTAPGPVPLRPVDGMSCPVCARSGAVRDFLSLAAPSRPARVVVRVVTPPGR